MRCLIVADLHYSLPQYDWVMQVADWFDVVIIAGDHLDLSSPVDIRAQSVVVRKYIDLLRAKTRLITCSGNHDLDSRDGNGEKVAGWISGLGQRGVPSDGQSFACEDTLFTVCPWWDGPLTRDRVAAQLAADASKRTGLWVWVHHAPPDNSPTSWAGDRYFGDAPLSEWIAEFSPDLVFSGHVHRSPFTKGGSWVDRIGDHLGVQCRPPVRGAAGAHHPGHGTSRRLSGLSAAGMQSVRLDQPLTRPVPALRALPAWLTLPDPAGGQNPA